MIKISSSSSIDLSFLEKLNLISQGLCSNNFKNHVASDISNDFNSTNNVLDSSGDFPHGDILYICPVSCGIGKEPEMMFFPLGTFSICRACITVFNPSDTGSAILRLNIADVI